MNALTLNVVGMFTQKFKNVFHLGIVRETSKSNAILLRSSRDLNERNVLQPMHSFLQESHQVPSAGVVQALPGGVGEGAACLEKPLRLRPQQRLPRQLQPHWNVAVGLVVRLLHVRVAPWFG